MIRLRSSPVGDAGMITVDAGMITVSAAITADPMMPLSPGGVSMMTCSYPRLRLDRR